MRLPVVSGSFYPRNKKQLTEILSSFKNKIKIVPARCYGVISPHAGYVYSGETAVAALSSVDLKEVETVVILGPNHTGWGNAIGISSEDWETPLGIIKNDIELSEKIPEMCLAKIDNNAHSNEHSIEVQLPLIQYLAKNHQIKIVAISMIDQTAESCEALAKAIFKISNDLNRKILIVASSDFTHYEAADIVEKKDRKLIAPLLAGDVKNFEETRKSENISCCGHGPIMVLAYYANLRGFGGAELLRYTHSGAITGDYTEVVGYAAVRFLETLF